MGLQAQLRYLKANILQDLFNYILYIGGGEAAMHRAVQDARVHGHREY